MFCLFSPAASVGFAMEDDTHHWTGPEERTMQVFMFNNLIIFAVLSIMLLTAYA